MRRSGLVGAAVGIAGVTAASRAVGFARYAVLSRTLGQSCVGDTYQAANTIPNVLFDVVAGGALAALVVPALVTKTQGFNAARTASALLTWTLAGLVPLSLLAEVAAPWLMRALVGGHPTCGARSLVVGTRMLRVFAPQVVLYGVGVVLGGVLQAHRRFLGPALAPLLSSLVVIGTYLVYAVGPHGDLASLSRSQELVLSVGTTLGVAVLSLSLLVPLRGTGVRLRPAWRFPPGVGRRLGALAAAGVAGLAAQQVALVVALRLAAHGPEGSVIVFTAAGALALLPWAVLAVPVATSAFPRLAEAAASGATGEYAATAARSVRLVVAATLAGAAVLWASAVPVARLLVAGAPGVPDPAALAEAVRAFAPGLVGAGLLALLTRALYACGDARSPGVATVAGWLAVAAADVALVGWTGLARVTALGLGNAVGMLLAAGLLLRAVRRATPEALQGAGRTAAAAAAGCLVAALLAAAAPVPYGRSVAGELGAAGLLGVLALAGYGATVALLDRSAGRELLRG